jgi:hypothetical protein
LNGSPVALTPTPPLDLVRPQDVADERERERLGDAHDRERDLGVADRVHAPLDRGHADAEERGRHAPRAG